MLEWLYAKGCQSQSNHHRLVTICWLQGEGVSSEWLLRAAFEAFRPGDDVHLAQLARWWANGRLEVQRLQLWTGSEPDERGDAVAHVGAEVECQRAGPKEGGIEPVQASRPQRIAVVNGQ